MASEQGTDNNQIHILDKPSDSSLMAGLEEVRLEAGKMVSSLWNPESDNEESNRQLQWNEN